MTPLRATHLQPGTEGFETVRYDRMMKTLTLMFYAATTFLLGALAISSIPIALASAYGTAAAQFVEAMTLVLMVAGPIVFIAAIPFAGSRRGEP
jgi:hypothetical protein